MRAAASRMSNTIVRVCTFNLRHGYVDHGTPNSWDKRRPILKACLERMQPHIIGTQEGDPPLLNEMLADLNTTSNRWSFVGESLDDWDTIDAIFYRHDLFKLIATKTFWFNEHPERTGAAWGAKHPRGGTRAHLEHQMTKQPFIIYNVHLDFPCQNARHHSIPVILSQIEQNGDHIDRVIVTGDFNNWPEDVEGETPVEELIVKAQKATEIEQMKKAGFVDTYQHGETPTFNGFRSAGYGPKIDFVWLSSKSIYRVEGETKVDEFADKDGFYPSDHFPVYADLIHQS